MPAGTFGRIIGTMDPSNLEGPKKYGGIDLEGFAYSFLYSLNLFSLYFSIDWHKSNLELLEKQKSSLLEQLDKENKTNIKNKKDLENYIHLISQKQSEIQEDMLNLDESADKLIIEYQKLRKFY